MSDLSIRSAQTVPDLTAPQSTSAEAGKKAASKTAQHHPVGTKSADPTDIIDTSATASSFLSSLNSQASIANPEQQKEFDEKQLKAAEKQLQLLKILGIGLSPEEFAKQTTDLAKQIAGIAKDYAANSGGSVPSASAAAPSATADAATTAQQADGAAQGATAKTAETSASQASTASQTSAATTNSSTATPAKQADSAAQGVTGKTAGTSTSQASTASQTSASSANSTSGSSTASATGSSASTASTTSTGSVDSDAAQAGNPNSFFAEIEADFKELKKLETRAISQLNLSPDKKKKDEAKKLGGEFNDAVNSTAQSANAAGADPSIGAAIAGQSIDLSKVAINLSA